jgi:hypothetical protein
MSLQNKTILRQEKYWRGISCLRIVFCYLFKERQIKNKYFLNNYLGDVMTEKIKILFSYNSSLFA